MELVIDALVAFDLLGGKAPAIGTRKSSETDFYLISYPEYLFLFDVAHEVAESRGQGVPLSEIGDELDSKLTTEDWLAIYLDLSRLTNLEGVPTELAIPSEDAARHILSIRRFYGLDERRATNLLLAEERGTPYVGFRSSLSPELRYAMDDRHIPILLVE